MRIACWIPKATNTHTLNLCNAHCYSTATLFFRTRLNINLYVEIKCQLDTTEVFIADLIACSTCFGHHYDHHQELKSIIQWLLPVVLRAVVFKLLVWCGAEGYVSGFQPATSKPQHEIPQAATTV